MTENILADVKLNSSILSTLGFDPCEPWEGWDSKYDVKKPHPTHYEHLAFNDSGLYRWYGYRIDSKGRKWYIVWNNITTGFFFQRQIKIETLGDLITAYKNSSGESLEDAQKVNL